jgi:N-acetyl-gamma-glutamyl-phosphate reductase
VVVDLSAAFRLKDTEVFERTYGFAHGHAGLLERAAYGVPEVNRARIAKADLIACGGCYATSAVVPLVALARAGAIDTSSEPIVDAISGVSGAGRGPTQAVHFCEVSVQPYKALSHRHGPEMAEQVGAHVHFTPHLGCYERGIVSTIHARLAPGWTGLRVREALSKAWAKEPFVRLLPDGHWPSAAGCERTNYCDVGLTSDDGRRHLLVVSALDNLVKGAAGQAVQCMNIRLGFPETEGLL